MAERNVFERESLFWEIYGSNNCWNKILLLVNKFLKQMFVKENPSLDKKYLKEMFLKENLSFGKLNTERNVFWHK